MMPLTFVFAVLLVALVMAASVHVAVMRHNVAPQARTYGLLLVFGFATLGCLVCLAWLFVAYDLVPREWNTKMRQEERTGKIEESNFVKGGIPGSGYSIEIGGARNVIYPAGIPGHPAPVAKVDLGLLSERKLALMSGGRVLMSGDLGDSALADLEFVVFDGERIYLFSWRNVSGGYWRRR